MNRQHEHRFSKKMIGNSSEDSRILDVRGNPVAGTTANPNPILSSLGNHFSN